MDLHSLEVLEFEKVRRMLNRWTFSVLGREGVRQLAPNLNLDEIRTSQERIAEWKSLELRGEAPGAAEIADLRPLLLRLQRSEGTLDALELYSFLPFLDHLAGLYRLRVQMEQHADLAPRLRQVLASIEDFSGLRSRLARSVSPDGEVLDSASPGLERVRRELLFSQQRASELLEGLRGRVEQSREESFVTLREGRYVISLRAQSRAQLPGLLHGRSHSGQSLLIEPLEAVEANNRVAEAREEEQREIVRVLRELSEMLRAASGSLAQGFSVTGVLDLIRAEAKLALELLAEPPGLNDWGLLRLVQGRHPILAEAEAKGGTPVVPLNLELKADRPVLVISGPNMGGKTVALKTVGLLLLMARAGLHVPAADGTTLPLADDVFVDLGDEQSIEGDLSTFAGHLRNVGVLWEKATDRSVVLLDELGGGTDPEEGGALARAILEGLAERGTLTVATTHLSSVKYFVAEQKGMQNGAMEFDADSLSPRFRLKIGEPGGSRAFDIARKILPHLDLLARAEKHRSPLLVQMDQMLAKTDQEKRLLESTRRELEIEKEQLHRATLAREKQAVRLKERLERLRQSRTEALGQLYREAEESMRSLRLDLEAKAKENPAAALPLVRRSEGELHRKVEEVQVRPASVLHGRKLRPEQIRPGQRAWIANLSAVVCIERVEQERSWVEWQGRRLIVQTASLEELPADRSALPPPERLSLTPEPPGDAAVERELDLRGCHVEEALERLDRFLDRAALGRQHQVRIVHGKGTGALKREIEKHLKSHPLISGFRLGELNEGGWGVTVVDLGTGG